MKKHLPVIVSLAIFTLAWNRYITAREAVQIAEEELNKAMNELKLQFMMILRANNRVNEKLHTGKYRGKTTEDILADFEFELIAARLE